MRSAYQQGQYQKAFKDLESSYLKTDKDSALLYLMQKAKLLHSMGQYSTAREQLRKALNLKSELYTRSVTKAIFAGLTNDQNSKYRGQIYEISMLYFYQAVSSLKLAQRGYRLIKTPKGDQQKPLSQDEKRKLLFDARAAIVAWDSFYQTLNNETDEKSLFKDDLLLKIFGAQVHQLLPARSDKVIALDLYIDALDTLDKQGMTFASFNEKYDDYFKAVYNDTKKEKNVATENYQDLRTYLLSRAYSLAQKYSKFRLKKLKKRYPMAKVEKNVANVHLIFEEGIVSPLEQQDFSYTIGSAFDSIEDPATRRIVTAFGSAVITYFAMGPLGLAFQTRSGNTRIYTSHNLGTTLTKEAGIEFSMPLVSKKNLSSAKANIYRVEVYQGDKKVDENKLILAQPVSDLAYQLSNELASKSYVKLGARLALKHVIAIIAAFTTYNSLKEKGGDFYARAVAFAQYVVSAKAIKATEPSDTRQWNTLPGRLYVQDLKLSKGSYQLKLFNGVNMIRTIALDVDKETFASLSL